MLKNGSMEPTIFLLTFPELFVELDGLTNEDFDDGLKKMIVKCYQNERFKKILKKVRISFLDYYYFLIIDINKKYSLYDFGTTEHLTLKH